MDRVISQIAQLFAAKPTVTEDSLQDCTGKVIIVTGASAGVGKEVSKILFQKNAKVYLAARSEEKATKAIADIRAAHPESAGELVFLRLDLADLRTVKAAAEEFLAKEKRLDILFNNAGLGWPEEALKTVQGHDLSIGTNCIGPFLFTELLTPVLASTAKVENPGATRVVWTSSTAAETPVVNLDQIVDNLDFHVAQNGSNKYSISKIGNYWHATEYARRHREDGIVSVAVHPGTLLSELWRTQGAAVMFLLRTFLAHPCIYGAYSTLFAGFAPEITLEKTGAWIAPWGCVYHPSKSLAASARPKSEGGTGRAEEFWNWSEEQVKPYL